MREKSEIQEQEQEGECVEFHLYVMWLLYIARGERKL